jgi:hypothetical protein
MFERASRVAIAVAGAVLVVSCSQSISPAAPSASITSPTAANSTASFQPVLARLNLVDQHLVSANHQLDLCLGEHPPGPCFQNSLDFYLKANAAFDGLIASIPPGPPLAPAADALNAIIAQAHLTLDTLVALPPGPPCIPQIQVQAQHAISVATALLSNTCNADQCTTFGS